MNVDNIVKEILELKVGKKMNTMIIYIIKYKIF